MMTSQSINQIIQDDTTTKTEGTINSVNNPIHVDISHIHDFLGCRTSQAWLDKALANLPTIIQDHANCEKKAAATAMRLIFSYENKQPLQLKLAQLIREEILHYEQVLGIMHERGQSWEHLSASRYAKGLLKYRRNHEPYTIIDLLIILAFIEARSCERFAALSAVVDDERLSKYYRYLLKSESRHYEDYLALAAVECHDTDELNERIKLFKKVEAELINSPDEEIRFHSGMPI